MASEITPYLDHIVILVPPSFLANPPKWLTEAFTLYPGGQHADGRTENTLVLLADGAYLEFIAFVPGADRTAHRWGRKPEGTVIDWALSVPTADAFKTIQQRTAEGSGLFRYSDLVAGGRHRPDGAELKWAVAGPYRGDEPVEPGRLPFWCVDETPRGLRVPYKEGMYADHASGAVGVGLVSVSVSNQEEVSQLKPVYDALLGKPASASPPTWDLDKLDSEKSSRGGQVRLDSVSNRGPDLSISFITTSSDFAGWKIGGEVVDGRTLEFTFLSAQ